MANIKTSGENISFNKFNDRHGIFHLALRDTNLSKIQEFMETGVKPYHKNKNKYCCVCYIIAQQNLNSDFLKVLLEHDSSRVNTTYFYGNSLLMQDIREYECRNFQLLIDHGADVNHCNEDGYTALHYATMNKKTPIDVIKKLIELKADVNKALGKNNNCGGETLKKPRLRLLFSCDGDTPLINVLKFCSDHSNGFEKVKLLVESGADVNLANGLQHTPLLFAAAIDLRLSDAKDHIKLMKYLIDHGAKASFNEYHNVNAISFLISKLQDIIFSDDLPAEEALIEEYFIPAFELLMEAGYDLFYENPKFAHFPNSPLLCLLFKSDHLCNKFTNGHKLVLHVVNLAFKKLNGSSFKFYKELQQDPIDSMLGNVLYVSYRRNLQVAFTKMAYSRPVQNFLNLTKNYYGGSIVETITWILPITEIKQWLVKLHELNFDFNRKEPLIFILLNRSINKNNDEQLIEIIDYLLEQKYDVREPRMWPKGYLTPRRTAKLIKTLNVPFCVWKSAELCDEELLKKFLPYWNQPPIAVLLCLKKYILSYSDENPAAKDFENLVLFLCEYGGPLSHGTILYNEMKKYIDSCLFPKVVSLLTELHESPASLKVLCRTVIRSNAVGHGNNLPNYLASLVPCGLKKFLTCDFS